MSTPVSGKDVSPAGRAETLDSSEARSFLGAGFRVVSLCTLASRILGLLRDMAMAALFGAGPVLDAFTVAFRLPNLARRLFGEGALTTAFLPVFVEELQSDDPDGARRVGTGVFFALAGVLALLVGVAEAVIGAALLTLSLSADARLLLELVAILSPYLVLICLAAQVSAMLHALKHFFWPALLPVVLNLAWLAAVAVAATKVETSVTQIRVISLVVVLAGVIQLLVVLAALRARGFRFTWNARAARPQVRRVFAAMLPIVVGLSITQFNAALDSLLAWLLAEPPPGTVSGASWIPQLVESGTASALYFGQRMYQFPLGVFGVALGTVLFPLLAEHAQRGDRAAVRSDLSYGVRLAIAIGLPSSAGLYVLSGPITSLLFQHGRFTEADAALTSQMVAVYGAAVWASIGLLIIHRGYYALGDRTTPVRIGLLAVAVNLALNLILVCSLGGVGLALATALAAAVQCILAAVMLQQRTGSLDWAAIASTGGKTLLATLLMTAACVVVRPSLTTSATIADRLVAVAAPMIAGAAVYLAAARAVRLREPWTLISRGSLPAE
ncbi:MAG: murein biosynthesis integral membrane protein MurJ [Planctomycetota bacterium]|nr:MAG: murein biosynthesis integral membrane protein MurJ [Planctomycetota bacterium]REK34309.1 MAG: murein biosynthesis integral membrane protein MurJ [Planctomycetota bacterium]